MCSGQGTAKRGSAIENDTISGGNGEGVPPVPIPNTEVKTFSAESTWLDTAREDRSPPDSIEDIQLNVLFFYALYAPAAALHSALRDVETFPFF